MSSEFTPVLPVDAVPENSSRAVQFQGRSVLICRSGDDFYAIENRCTHQFNPLEGGRIRNHHISCPVHGVRFDLRTGEPRGELARCAVPTFALRIRDGQIEIADQPL